jgi:hypothetical protein
MGTAPVESQKTVAEQKLAPAAQTMGRRMSLSTPRLLCAHRPAKMPFKEHPNWNKDLRTV